MIETKAGKEQQGAQENFRQRRFSYRSRLLRVSSPSRRMEIFNLTLRLRRDACHRLSSHYFPPCVIGCIVVSEKDGNV